MKNKMPESETSKSIESVLRSLVPVIERKRKKSYFWLLVSSVILVVVITAVLITYMHDLTNATVTSVSSCLIPVIILYQILNRKYMSASKDIMVKHLAEQIEYTCKDGGIFTIKDVQKHLIVPAHDSREIESGVQGVYNNISMAMQDVTLSGLHLKSNKANQLVPGKSLRGVMVRFKLNRMLSGHTVSLPHIIVPPLYAGSFNGYQQVKSPNIKYEKMYEILTTDTVEAKAIMSSTFSDRLMEAMKIMKAGWMMISLVENEILLIFQCRPLELEPTPLWRPVTADHMLLLSRPFEAIYKVIDAIRANHQL